MEITTEYFIELLLWLRYPKRRAFPICCLMLIFMTRGHPARTRGASASAYNLLRYREDDFRRIKELRPFAYIEYTYTQMVMQDESILFNDSGVYLESWRKYF